MILLDFEWAISSSFHTCKRFPFKNSCIKLDFDSSDMNNVRLKLQISASCSGENLSFLGS